MMPSIEALEWTITQAVTYCKEWPGISEIRGLLETKYTAADGRRDPGCSIPGFTAADGERRYMELQAARERLEISGPSPEKLLDVSYLVECHSLQPSAPVVASKRRGGSCTCQMGLDAAGRYEMLRNPQCPRHAAN
jgi:hypothetical protein